MTPGEVFQEGGRSQQLYEIERSYKDEVSRVYGPTGGGTGKRNEGNWVGGYGKRDLSWRSGRR